MFTKDRLLQKNFAQRVYDWALEQLTKMEVSGSQKPLQQLELEMQKKRPQSSSASKLSIARPGSAAFSNFTNEGRMASTSAGQQ
jgi:hypothetical protein